MKSSAKSKRPPPGGFEVTSTKRGTPASAIVERSDVTPGPELSSQPLSVSVPHIPVSAVTTVL
jgi:hypothetical protein